MDADLIVVGGGISGLTLAWRAARDGRSVVVLEASPRAGGCLYSHRDGDFWHEIGGHTVYNSYGRWLELIVEADLADRLVPRGAARAQFGFLRDDGVRWLTPYGVLGQLDWLEAASAFLTSPFRPRGAETMQDKFTRLAGRGNFQRVLSPFLSAVPSQAAGPFPAAGPGSLFKRRDRRKEFPRSFGLEGGLQTVCDALAAHDAIDVRTEQPVTNVAETDNGYAVTTASGQVLRAPQLALAVPPSVAARLLEPVHPDLADTLAGIETVEVESVGVTLPADRCWMPPCAFVVPASDLFHSVVTRDPFPHETRRGFTFHFRGDVPTGDQLARMAEVLRVSEAELGDVVRQRVTIPAPRLGHDEIVNALDEALVGRGLALVGNYFDGLAIEDCVQRSEAEWARLSEVALRAPRSTPRRDDSSAPERTSELA